MGKSTLIDGLLDELGFYQTIHFGKPKVLKTLKEGQRDPLKMYQSQSFANSMLLAKSGARIIFDRWHLGEAVYAELYRGYAGDYVFTIEQFYEMESAHKVRLILLTEDFDRSKHFVSDGESFDDTNRREEQELFVHAFHRSVIQDKRIICVTGENGQFRPKEEILKEALEVRDYHGTN